MVTSCSECPLRRRAPFAAMSEEEVRQTQRFKVGEMLVEAGTPVLTEGAHSAQLFTILSGLGLRYKTLPNGRRQVLNFVFPGDLIGLQAAVMGKMGHTVEARSRMRLCVFDRSTLWDFSKASPARAYDIVWLASNEEHFLGEALATIGQRNAEQAVAWALVRLFAKGAALELTVSNTMTLPFKQQDLADALGLSLVHTNKTLAKLRERRVATWRDGVLTVNDLDALARSGLTGTDAPRRRPLV